MEPAHALLFTCMYKGSGQGEQQVCTVLLGELGHLGQGRQESGGTNKQEQEKERRLKY